MGTNRIFTTCFAICFGVLIANNVLAQYGASPHGSHQGSIQNNYQRQANAQYQRDMQAVQARQMQQYGKQQYGGQQLVGRNPYHEAAYQQSNRPTDQAGQLPSNPHYAAQVQYTQQRLVEEEAIARDRAASQQQRDRYLGTGNFPRRLPSNQSVGYRTWQQDDPFGDGGAEESAGADPFGDGGGQEKQSQTQDPFGEPAGISPFAEPPAQDNPSQQTQPDPFGEAAEMENQVEPGAIPDSSEILLPENRSQENDDMEYPPNAVTPEMIEPRPGRGTGSTDVLPDLGSGQGLPQIVTPEQIPESAPTIPMYPESYPPTQMAPRGTVYPPAMPNQIYGQQDYGQQAYPQEMVQPYPTQNYGAPSYVDPAYSTQGYPTHPQYSQPSHPNQNFAATPGSLPLAAESSVYQGVVSDCGVVDPQSECEIGLGRCGCPGFYLSVYGGLVDLQNINIGNNTFITDDGGGFGVALGQRHGHNLRSELDFTYRTNDLTGLQNINNTVVTLRGLNGELTSYTGMANVYWEFMNFGKPCFKPYIGAGLGFASLDADISGANGQNVLANNDTQSSFAYQFMAGVNYKAYRNMDMFVEYRYMKADELRLDTIPSWGGGQFDYETNNLFAGVRWKF